MMPPEFEAAADVCFAASAVEAAGASSRRPVLLEELSRRLAVLREALEPRGDRIFHNGVHRSKRAMQALVLACEDWLQDGAVPGSASFRVVSACYHRVGELTKQAADRAARATGGGETCPTPGRPISKTSSEGAEA